MKDSITTCTDTQLQLALVKIMLVDALIVVYDINKQPIIRWNTVAINRPVEDTEWLYVCWLIEQQLKEDERLKYKQELQDMFPFSLHYPTDALLSTWQQRAIALASVKGIEIEQD